MKSYGLLVVASLWLAPLLPGAALEPGDPFPPMAGRALDNKTPRALPDAADGKPFYAVFVFSRGARDSLQAWAVALLESDETRGASVFQIPMMERAPGFIRWMIRRDIRNDAPQNVHHTFLLMTTDEKAWRERLGVEDDAYVYVAAVSADGRFLGVHTGPFSDQAFSRFIAKTNAD